MRTKRIRFDRIAITVVLCAAAICPREASIRETLTENAVPALTLDSALRMATIRNPEFKAAFADLEAAGAARRQDRLFLSPTAEASYRFGEKQDRADIAVTEDLSHLLLYPLKWGLSGARYREARIRVAINTADRQLEVKQAFYAVQVSQQIEAILQANRESADAAAELAERQLKAGNINALQQDVQIGMQQDAVLESMHARNEAALARQNLALLIGMTGTPESLHVADTLAPLPAADPPFPELVRLALDRGPELGAAQAAEIAAGKSLWLTRLSSMPVRAGVDWELEGNDSYLGPKVEIQVPLDLGWNAAAKAKWEREAARQRVHAADAGVRSRIGSLLARMSAARSTARYFGNTVLPHRERVLEETQKHYNFMLEGVYELIQARQRVYAAQREILTARKEYWFANAELERVLGSPIPSAKAQMETIPNQNGTVPEPAPAAPSPSGNHDHGGH